MNTSLKPIRVGALFTALAASLVSPRPATAQEPPSPTPYIDAGAGNDGGAAVDAGTTRGTGDD